MMNKDVTTQDDDYIGDPEIGIERAEDGETPKEVRRDTDVDDEEIKNGR